MQNLEERCKLLDHQNCVSGWAYSSKQRYSSFFIIRFSRLNASSHPSAKLVGPSCQQTHKLDIDDLGNEVTFQPKGGDFSTNHLMHRTSRSQCQINQHHEIMNATLFKQMGYSLFNLYFNICKLFSANSWTSLSALKICVHQHVALTYVCGHIKVPICAKYYCWPTGVCTLFVGLIWLDYELKLMKDSSYYSMRQMT